MHDWHLVIVKKCSFYIAQYPVRWTAQSAVHFFALPGRPVDSGTNSASPGSILAMQQLSATTKSLTFPPLSIARYSFIQLSQLKRQWRERKCQIFETVAKRIRTRAHLIASPAFYRWATALVCKCIYIALADKFPGPDAHELKVKHSQHETNAHR